MVRLSSLGEQEVVALRGLVFLDLNVTMLPIIILLLILYIYYRYKKGNKR